MAAGAGAKSFGDGDLRGLGEMEQHERVALAGRQRHGRRRELHAALAREFTGERLVAGEQDRERDASPLRARATSD